MDLELTDDQLALQAAARSVLASACPPTLVRSVYEQRGADEVAELWQTLVGLDWPALGLPAEHGGLGLGFVEVGVIIEELGRVVAPTPYLATVTQLGATLLEVGPAGAPWLPGLAAGEVTGTLAVAEGGRWTPEAVATTARRSGAGWVLDGTKHHVFDGATADELAVVALGESGLGVFLVPAAQVSATPLAVMDPTLPLATVSLADVEIAEERVLVAPGDPRADAVVARSLEAATAALALSTVATCRMIFEATLAYAKEREQFGRPIGSFQAIKHRLADCYLAVERAAALAWFAVLTIAEDDERRPVACAMAKAAAGDCQRLLTRDGLQLHGGIGFTWEHDLHLHLKRAATGEHLLGGSGHHRARLARLLGLEEVVA